MSDFCKNCNPHSLYHTTTVGECVVDIWFAEICQLTMCVFGSQSQALSKSTGLLCGSTASFADPYNVLFQKTFQLTLLGMHQCLLDMHQCSHVVPQTIVLTIAVKVLGMLYLHTNPLSLHWSWYWETYIQSSCQITQVLRFKNRQNRQYSSNKCPGGATCISRWISSA